MGWSSAAYRRTLALAAVLCAVMAGYLLLPGESSASPRTGDISNLPAVVGTEALARAQAWVDARIDYGQTHYYQGYPRDCVGLVSMAWGVAVPGMGNTTKALNYVTQISQNDLQPGDALLNAQAHIVLFAGWANNEHTAYNGYEESDGYKDFKGARFTRATFR